VLVDARARSSATTCAATTCCAMPRSWRGDARNHEPMIQFEPKLC
jgi:hypothetical protein